MEEKLIEAIEVLKQKVEQKAKELNDAKKAVNQFCVLVGEQPVYEISGEPEIGQLATNLKGHEYYKKPLATVITDILERRGFNNGPMTVKEIYEQMKSGGFLFETKNDENAMRNIRISMAKNTQTFHKLPGGKFGLLKWFPEVKGKKAEQGKSIKIHHRRGRPPKVLTLSDLSKTTEQTEQPKRRGRPPKQITQTEIKAEPPKE